MKLATRKRLQLTDTPTVLTPKELGGLKVVRPDSLPPFVNFLVYGEPGVGKTCLAASASQVEAMHPVLLLDVEGGTLSLRKLYPDVDIVRIKSFLDFVEVHKALRQPDSPYRTVILDSLTEIQKLGMYEIMRKTVEKDEDRDPDLPGIGEWGKNIEQTRKIVRAFRNLPAHVIVTGLVMTEKQKNGKTLHKPSLSGKLSGEVAGFFDIVVYMYLKDRTEAEGGGTTRNIMTQGTENYVAKDRTDNLPTVMVDTNMQEIHAIINN